MAQKIIVDDCYYIELPRIGNSSGEVLSAAENLREIPFAIKRVYYIYGFSREKHFRGGHAHLNLEQAIFCLNGSFKLIGEDGNKKQSFLLNNPSQGLYIGPGLWHTLEEISHGCVILVMASDYYDEKDYIRDYQQFIRQRSNS